jgi:putative membrane protein
VTAGELLRHGWTWRPGVVLVLSAWIAVHVTRLRFTHPGRTLALLAAAAAALLALASPIELLARGTLFSAHMLQHMLLTLVLPPLALLSLPRRSSDAGDRGANVLAPWTAGVGAMWIWHASPLCNAAATSEAVRALQSLSLPVLGAAFWWPIVGPQLGRRLTEPVAVVYLLSACLACTLLGVSIAFSPVEVCSAYGHPADPLGLLPLVRGWGLTREVDQQLGGLLMWIPGCAAYAGAVLAIVARFYAAAQVKVQEAS